jgi:glycosyltransferase involved in cell wall biosynthesis
MSRAPVDVSIILPIYDERDNLEPLLQEIAAAMARVPERRFEVIAVDDGSRDGSAQLLRRLCQERSELRGILFRRNSGQSAAFDAGFRAASGQVVVTMDADRQNDPADIPAMLKRLDEGFDLVAGWRKRRRDGFFLRKLPSWIANYLVRKVTGTQVHDLGCSLKAYRAEVLKEIRLYGEMHRFLCPLLEMIGARVTEMEVHHRRRPAGRSKYGVARTMKVLLDLIHIWYLQNYRTKPIYIFGGVGFLGVLAGFLCSALCLYEKLRDGIWVHRNPLFLVSMACFLIGFQFIAVGLLAETLVRTYFESQGKAAYQIRETLGFAAGPQGAAAEPGAVSRT